MEKINNNDVYKQNFIKKCTDKFGDKYDYSEIDYINKKTKVKITCNHHGEFFILPTEHLRSNTGGCRGCFNHKLKEGFLENAINIFGDKFDYSKIDYKGTEHKISIKCVEHNLVFIQTPAGHLKSKKPCPECLLNNKLLWICENKIHKQKQFIEKANLKYKH